MPNTPLQKINVIDSHTAGEPTRVVIDGIPDLGTGTLAQRTQIFAEHHDAFRRAIVNEPRGSDVLVGALLLPPTNPEATAAVIFFNNVAPLGMCGHGSIGLASTLIHLNRITPGLHTIETPVGDVQLNILSPNETAVQNVPSYRTQKNVTLNVPNLGPITGDIAWGGNWFFLVDAPDQNLTLANTEQLTQTTWAIRQALQNQNITGDNNALIDHIELFGPPHNPTNHSRNFVLCPGKAYDRSPCGTGLSAKIACLIDDGKITPNQTWCQESVLGSVFTATAQIDENKNIIPTIQGSAYVTAESTLIINPNDPFAMGINP